MSKDFANEVDFKRILPHYSAGNTSAGITCCYQGTGGNSLV